MFKTRARKIIRDIWSRKARTALVSISIFIGVFGTIMLFTMGDLLVKQLKEDLDQDKLAMIRSFVAVKPGVPVDNEATLESLREINGVTAVQGIAVSKFFWQRPGEEDFESSTIFGYSEGFEEIELEPMRLLEGGSYPTPGANEIVVEQRFADEYGLDVGDTLTLRLLSEVNGGEAIPTEDFTISGLVFFAYSYGGGFTPVQPNDAVFALYEDAERIADFPGYSAFYARFEDYATAEVNMPRVERLINQSAYVPVFTLSEDPAENSLITFTETTANTMGSLAMIALIVSGFLVINVITAIVTEQKQQIGVMKALGATQADTFIIFTGIATLYGIIGIIPGVILGIPFGYFAAEGLAEESLTYIDSFAVSPRAIVLGVAMGLAVPILASLIPVLNAIRVRIIEAITDLGIDAKYGTGPAAHLIERLPLPINVRQGVSNITRKKGRIAFTTVTLAVAVGAFMGVWAVFESIDEVFDNFFNTYNYDLGITANETTDVPAMQALLAENFADLDMHGPGFGIAIEIEGYEKEYDPNTGPPALFAAGYDPNTDAYRIKFESGGGLEDNPDGVILSSGIADDMGKRVGDVVTITTGGNADEFPIVGIADFPYDGVWFHWETLTQLAGFVDEAGQPASPGLLMSLDKEDPTAADVEDLAEEIDEVLLANGINVQYENTQEFVEQLTSTVATFRIITNSAALLIALVGAVGLLSTLSMSVFERQKEIGVMRSIGAGSGTIITQFLTEGIVVGIVAWVIGLPLGYMLNTGLIDTLGLGDEYKLGFPIIAAIIGLVGMVGITIVASIWPSVAASRKTVSEILRYQ